MERNEVVEHTYQVEMKVREIPVGMMRNSNDDVEEAEIQEEREAAYVKETKIQEEPEAVYAKERETQEEQEAVYAKETKIQEEQEGVS